MIATRLAQPIVQAPLAGGPSTPALAIAVSRAGGLGFLAAGYRRAAEVREQIGELRAATPAPFGVNVFVAGAADVDERLLGAYVERLRSRLDREGPELGPPRVDDDDWGEKIELLCELAVPVVSFTFGCPAPEVIGSLRAAGSEVWVTVTEPAEARAAAVAGADVLVAQGIEAGGHRGGFEDSDESEGLGLLVLLRLLAAESELPLVAAGGLCDGAAVAAALAAGACAAQVGTAFLLAREAATNPAHRDALGAPTPTALTRAFSGRLARGLVNRFMAEHGAHAPSAYPQIHHVTAPLRAQARARDDAQNFNLWAGQAHQLASEGSAAEIVASLSDGARRALAEAERRLGRQPES